MTSPSGLYSILAPKAHWNRLNLPLAGSVPAFLSMLLLLPFVAAAALAAGAPARPPVTGPVVQIATGQLRGTVQGTTAVFLGIPFAAPAGGRPALARAQPPIAWSGARDATKPGSSCVQNPAGIGTFIQPLDAATEKPTTSYRFPFLRIVFSLTSGAPN